MAVGLQAEVAVAQGRPAATTGKKDKGKAKEEPKSGPATPATDMPQNAVPASAVEGGKTETAPTAPAPQAEDHSVKMRGLEERVNDLKEKIFRSKARLMLLRETVLSGAIAGAKAVIVHDNKMGSNFVLESASYALDGAPLFNKVDSDGDLSEKETIELFAGNIVPGNHNLTVSLVYHGSGFGVFSYLKGYKFKVKSSYAITAEEGKVTTVRVVAYEKGGITTDLQDRPAIRYDVEVKQDQAEAPPAKKEGGAEPAAKAQ
ncbi:MAG: dihydrolipoamide acetyltransferase [Myxococcota bacterium]